MHYLQPTFENLSQVVWCWGLAAARVAFVGVSLSVATAFAAQPSLLSDQLFGKDSGIRIEPVYYGEVFSNARGGLRTSDATQYQGLVDLVLEFDFETMQTRLPGRVVVLAQNTHGRGLTEDIVGDALVLSNLDSFGNLMRVSEYWWEIPFGDDIKVRIGKQDLNTEFLLIETAQDFIQSTYGLSPSTAFPTFPDPSMAAVALLQLDDAWRLKMGVWDVFASGGSWGFSGNDSVLVIGELERSYVLRNGTLPGVVAIGAVYEASGELNGAPLSSLHEYVFQWEQQVFRECPCSSEDMQGLVFFLGYYPRFPGRLISKESIGTSFVTGLVYTGLLPSRDDDVLGLGYSAAELFAGGSNRESNVELFYKLHVTPRVSLQPDIQYISTPGGILRDSIVVGMRFEIGW